jgi:hypothetical protein
MDTDFWFDAFVQGGGAGVIGDLVGSFKNDRVDGLAEYLGGPVVSFAGDAAKTVKSAFKVDQDKPASAAAAGSDFGYQASRGAPLHAGNDHLVFARGARPAAVGRAAGADRPRLCRAPAAAAGRRAAAGAGSSIALPSAPSRADRFMRWANDGKSLLMLSASAVSLALAPSMVPLLPQGLKGDPGGNAMAIGLMIFAGNLNIPVGTDLVQTSGHSAVGLGIARYSYDASVDAAYVAAHPKSSFRSLNGRGFKYAEPIADLRQLGAAADLVTDDHDALAAAVALNLPIALSGASIKATGGHVLQSDAAIYGPGRIEWDASTGAQWFFSLGADGGGANLSNIAIERVHLTSSSDRAFMHWVRVANSAGTIDGFYFNLNRVDYTPSTGPGAGDRWVIAGTNAGTRINFQLIGNQTIGPMQLLASPVGTGIIRHWDITHNRIHNARANAISLLAISGAPGTLCTLEDVNVTDNDITCDSSGNTAIGIAVGIDGAPTNVSLDIRRLTLARNAINIVASLVKQADIYIRIGSKCAAVGGRDSANDTIVIDDNQLHYGLVIDQSAISGAATLARIVNFHMKNNDVFGGDVTLRHLADGAMHSRNTYYYGANVRPGENNGQIHSSDNIVTQLAPSSANSEFTWIDRGDEYIGTASGTDRPVTLNANAGKVQTFDKVGGSIDSYSTGLRYNMVSTNGAGNPTATLRNVGTSTAWVNGRYERVSGTIVDYTGGELFTASVDPPSLAAGAMSGDFTLNNVYGAQAGDEVRASFSLDLQGIQLSARVTGPNTIKYRFHNPSGNPTGTVDLGTGTLRARFYSQAA